MTEPRRCPHCGRTLLSHSPTQREFCRSEISYFRNSGLNAIHAWERGDGTEDADPRRHRYEAEARRMSFQDWCRQGQALSQGEGEDPALSSRTGR